MHLFVSTIVKQGFTFTVVEVPSEVFYNSDERNKVFTILKKVNPHIALLYKDDKVSYHTDGNYKVLFYLLSVQLEALSWDMLLVD